MTAALLLVLILVAIPLAGVGLAGLRGLFGIILPYDAFALFIVAFVWKVGRWASSPVPFHVPVVAGQQRSLPWIKSARTGSPSTRAGVVGRLALEVLLFRSLFKGERVEVKPGERLVWGSSRYLWLGGLLFHWSLAVVLFRHLRFFTNPVLPGIDLAQRLDGLFQLGTPTFFLTDVAILASLTYLVLRRFLNPQVRLISLVQDYFALFLLGAIVVTGVLMRVFFHPDIAGVKELAMGLVTFHPILPSSVGLLVYVHLFLVSALLVYFPFSKLMHAPGIFLSPTKNLRNDSRAVRHVNEWNCPVKVHTYEEWEDEFRTAMKEAGVPVEKDA